MRPGLMPEFPVYASVMTDAQKKRQRASRTHRLRPRGAPQVIVDWKSDVEPAPETLEHYRAQVRAYLDMTEAERGLIVLATPGTVIEVTRSVAAPAT